MKNGTPLYEELLTELKSYAEPEYAAFHRRLLKNDKINVLGVRVPILRKTAKKYVNSLSTLLSYPDEYYEVTFVKVQAAALLPYDAFVGYADKCVALLDNWATCDCFTPKCIAQRKDDFLTHIFGYANSDKEFAQRFALTTLLHYYVEEKYLESIFGIVKENVNLNLYYVHMAAAWLIAEVLVKFYDEGVRFLKLNAESYDKDGGSGFFDINTHNTAIRKACESYRLTEERKNFLKGLKR